ncbi:MAG: DUF2490 domain-containing protein [Chitinophagaceae bacterium]|nr:DUF2490 domain-containing protein [Chitinophagaceae bacterium]
MHKTQRTFKRSLLIVCLLTVLSIQLTAQQEWKNWNSIRIEAAVNKKTELEIGHLRSYGINNQFKNEFNQTAIQLQYKHNRKWSFSTGLQLIKPTGAAKTRTRIFGRAAYTLRVINRKLNWTNSLRVEHNSLAEKRFRQRIILGTRLSLRKRIEFLNLLPSVSYNLFYNLGGNAISYYDEENKLIDRSAPDGFHRGRFTANLNTKINDYLRLNLFFMSQREFNLFVSETNRMNVYNPVRRRIIRPFDNYHVIGASLTVSLSKLY